jgi:hypothetical protein
MCDVWIRRVMYSVFGGTVTYGRFKGILFYSYESIFLFLDNNTIVSRKKSVELTIINFDSLLARFFYQHHYYQLSSWFAWYLIATHKCLGKSGRHLLSFADNSQCSKIDSLHQHVSYCTCYVKQSVRTGTL